MSDALSYLLSLTPEKSFWNDFVKEYLGSSKGAERAIKTGRMYQALKTSPTAMDESAGNMDSKKIDKGNALYPLAKMEKTLETRGKYRRWVNAAIEFVRRDNASSRQLAGRITTGAILVPEQLKTPAFPDKQTDGEAWHFLGSSTEKLVYDDGTTVEDFIADYGIVNVKSDLGMSKQHEGLLEEVPQDYLEELFKGPANEKRISSKARWAKEVGNDEEILRESARRLADLTKRSADLGIYNFAEPEQVMDGAHDFEVGSMETEKMLSMLKKELVAQKVPSGSFAIKTSVAKEGQDHPNQSSPMQIAERSYTIWKKLFGGAGEYGESKMIFMLSGGLTFERAEEIFRALQQIAAADNDNPLVIRTSWGRGTVAPMADAIFRYQNLKNQAYSSDLRAIFMSTIGAAQAEVVRRMQTLTEAVTTVQVGKKKPEVEYATQVAHIA